MKLNKQLEQDVLESYFFLMLKDNRISNKNKELIAKFETEVRTFGRMKK